MYAGSLESTREAKESLEAQPGAILSWVLSKLLKKSTYLKLYQMYIFTQKEPALTEHEQ